MLTKIQIAIPTPCHENWEAMSPTDKGRFCASCQKKVYDFTTASDKEIISVLNREANACGRFTPRQLNRDLQIPKEKSSTWMAASAAVLGLLTLGTANAQTPVPTEQHEQQPNYMLGKFIAQPQLFTGKVTNEADGAPLPFVTVTIKGTATSVQTDADGAFSINASHGTMLTFEAIGFEGKEVTISGTKAINVVMYEYSATLSGDIVVVKNRTFRGRIFHSIGNIFR